MAVFAYKGINPSGKAVKGTKDADSAKALRAQLKRSGILVTEILERSEADKKSAREINFAKYFNTVSAADLGLATQQLAVLLRSGIPLVEALTALIEQLDNPEFKNAFTDTRDKVNEGTSFANALRAHPRYFSGLYVSMVSAGEASGTLEVVLERLSDFLERQADLRSKVQGAMAYPVVMMGVGVLVMMVLMGFVVPKVSSVYESFSAALPWYTTLLIAVSDFIADFWWLVFIGLGGAFYAFRRWKATPKGRERWDNWMLKAPLIGDLTVKVAVSRFARTLSTLLSSGVPVLQAMEITKNVLGNVELMKVIDTARESVREGEGLAKPLKESERFPPIVTHMIAIGERSGQLEQMLENVAKAYDQQVSVRVDTMTRLLEPLIIVVMGVMVGSIAMAILIPLMSMSEYIG